ncbi:hypothetical protein VTJ49DRAFT_4310 [Mycothermus thermophilus]|uniref:FAD-containing monooxygenase EthA n=1 Tax=Humicola insolens TaxID=85995 RepID=A0ABR3V5N8_HUMIN
MDTETLDIVIVGAGLSGINAAYRVKTELPQHSFAVLERRTEVGGTWAFWKYPGFRTDSAMSLFGFAWRPWTSDLNMAPGPLIKKYLEESVAAAGLHDKIRFGHRLASADWSSDEQRWTLRVDISTPDGTVETRIIKAWWVIFTTGYYSYEKPLPTVIPGIDRFQGRVVHPQFWDESLSYAGKRVIIIGSGATAITLLPAMAETAESVTMLQRTPSFVMTLPARDGLYDALSRFLPSSWARQLHWWIRMTLETLFVLYLRVFPASGRKLLLSEMRQQLPKGFDVERHFNPWYNPFEQRLCFCPAGDFFKALHRPGVRVVTDVIDTVTETGIQLKSGAVLDADIIVTATGLYFALLSTASVRVDGEAINDTIGNRYIWNGSMLEGLPNSGMITGYTAATWTPGADVRTKQLLKVIRHMDKTGIAAAAPYVDPAERARMGASPAVTLSSTYVRSALDRIPKVGDRKPWVYGSCWAVDMWRLLTSDVRQGMRFWGNQQRD